MLVERDLRKEKMWRRERERGESNKIQAEEFCPRGNVIIGEIREVILIISFYIIIKGD